MNIKTTSLITLTVCGHCSCSNTGIVGEIRMAGHHLTCCGYGIFLVALSYYRRENLPETLDFAEESTKINTEF
jgi:hypothetical protein